MRRNITAVLCTAQTVDKVTENTHKKNAENAIERSAENEARKNSETEKIFLILCLLKHYFVRLPCFCPLAVPLYSFGAKNTTSRHLSRSLTACRKTLFSTSCAVLCTAFILILSAFGASAATTAAAGTVTTSQGRLYVRSSPGGSIVSSLAKGSNVALSEKENGWYKVEYAAGKYGYSSADYISEIKGSTYKYVKTTSGRLYVRSSPAGTVINSLASGSKVAVISESNGWSKVVYNGNSTGYVSSAYLVSTQSSSGKYKAIKLTVPDFKQTDSRWANHKIGSTNYTIGYIGCTTTALAMSESYRTGTTIYPHQMESKLTYSSTGSLYWPSNYLTTTDFSNYLARIYSLLEQGKPVIVGAKKADSSQHWVIVTGCKATDSLKPTDFIINDPGTSERTNLGHFFSTYHYLHRIVWYK